MGRGSKERSLHVGAYHYGRPEANGFRLTFDLASQCNKDGTLTVLVDVRVLIREADPLTVFAEQVSASMPYPNRSQMMAVEEMGQQLYDQLVIDDLDEALDVQTYIQKIVLDINRANRFEDTTDEDALFNE